MSVFSVIEREYLDGQRLGRLATVGPDGAPHVVPVSFAYNGSLDTIDIGGHALGDSKKWRDIGRDPRVAFVVDDLLPPWQPRKPPRTGQSALGGRGTARPWVRRRADPHHPHPDPELRARWHPRPQRADCGFRRGSAMMPAISPAALQRCVDHRVMAQQTY